MYPNALAVMTDMKGLESPHSGYIFSIEIV